MSYQQVEYAKRLWISWAKNQSPSNRQANQDQYIEQLSRELQLSTDDAYALVQYELWFNGLGDQDAID